MEGLMNSNSHDFENDESHTINLAARMSYAPPKRVRVTSSGKRKVTVTPPRRSPQRKRERLNDVSVKLQHPLLRPGLVKTVPILRRKTISRPRS